MEVQQPNIPADNQILFFRRDRECYRFLSNFYPAPVLIDGETWPTVEHYYLAQKSDHPEYRDQIRAAASPGHAKRLGADPSLPKKRSAQSWFRRNAAAMRPDWQEVKLEVMRTAVAAKFLQNPELAQRLRDTGTAQLVEDSANDAYWGSGKTKDGLNWLGRILMEVRSRL